MGRKIGRQYGLKVVDIIEKVYEKTSNTYTNKAQILQYK